MAKDAVNSSEINCCCRCLVAQSCRVWVFATPWTAAGQASLSFTTSWSLLKLMAIESMMPSNYLILYHPLLVLPSIFLGTRVFSNKLALCIRWPKYWSFSFSISPSNEHSGLISLQSYQESSPAPQFESINSSAHYAKWNNPDREKQMLHDITCMWVFKKVRLIETDRRKVVAGARSLQETEIGC